VTLSLEEKITEVTTVAFGSLDPPSIKSIHENLRGIHTVDSGFIDLAHRLLTTGTTNGREEARLSFTLVSNYIGHGRTAKERRESLVNRVSVLAETMHEKWSCGNLLEEVGEYRMFSLTLSGMRHYNESVAVRESPLAVNRNDAYWRGLAVLSLVLGDKDTWDTRKEGLITFIEWAGHHHNASDIVRTGIDREITDLNKLRALIEDKAALSVPVQDGYL
jgi:hypothetical protein